MSQEIYRHPKPTKLAELDLGSHAVIEASAGTGKTYTLEHLIIDVVLETPTPIDDILVVTFTRRATSEMTERVRQRFRHIIGCAQRAGVSGVPTLGEQGDLFGDGDTSGAQSTEGPVWEIDARRLRRLKRALNDFGRAPIHTIHSFCQRILQEYAFSNRRLFEEEHVDDRRLFEEVFFETLRCEMSTDPELQRWLQAYVQVVGDGIDGLADALYGDHQRRASLRPRPDAAQRSEMLEALRDQRFDEVDEDRLEVEARTTLLEAVEARLEERKQRDGLFTYDDMLELVWANLRGRRGDELAEAIRERFSYALVDEFQDTDPIQWKIFRKVFLNHRDNHLFVIGDPKQAIYGFRGADVDTYQDAAERVASEGKQVDLQTNYRSTPQLIDAYNEIFTDEAEQPFFEGERFSYEEPVGCGFEGLSLEGADGDSVPAVEMLEPTGYDDWSTDDIRRTLREGIADEIEAVLSGERPLWMSEPAEATDGAGEVSESEAEPGAERRRVEASDIFVLTVSKRRGEEIGEALDRRGIPYAFYRKEGLFRTDEAAAIRDVLRGVARPDRRAWRLQAYMTPFFELSLTELERADEMEGPRAPRRLLDRWHALSEAGDFERLFDQLIDESGLARRLLLFEQSERTLTNVRHIFEILAEEAHRGDHDAGSLAARLTAFIEQRAEPEGEDTDLQRLESDASAVQIMTIHKSKGLEAPLVFLYGGLNRSRMAGKTFKEQSDRAQGGRDGEVERQKVRYTSRSAMTAEQKRQAEAHFDSEARRLMYVAITRGVGRVYLPYLDEEVESGCQYGSMRGKYKPVNRRLQALAPKLQAYPSEWFERKPVEFREPVADTASASSVEGWEAWSPPEWLRADPTDQSYFDELKRGRFRTITSFTALKSQADVTVGRTGRSRRRSVGGDVGSTDVAESGRVDREETSGTVDPSASDAEKAGERRVPGGIRTGLLVHSLLEQVDRGWVRQAASFDAWRSRRDVTELVDRLWARYPLADAHRRRVEQMVWRAMRQPIEVLGEASMAEVDAMAREANFYFPIPEEEHPPLGEWRNREHHDTGAPRVTDGFVTGEIDVLFEHEGSVWVADWKTNLAETYASRHLRRLVDEQYRQQVQLYAMAAAKMLGVSDAEAFEEQFGGVLYLFVRGMGPEEHRGSEPRQRGVAEVTPAWSELVEYAQQIGDVAMQEGPRE